jgi:hypothetical protein
VCEFVCASSEEVKRARASVGVTVSLFERVCVCVCKVRELVIDGSVARVSGFSQVDKAPILIVPFVILSEVENLNSPPKVHPGIQEKISI